MKPTKSVNCTVTITETCEIEPVLQYFGIMSGAPRPQLERHHVSRSVTVTGCPEKLRPEIVGDFLQAGLDRIGGINLDSLGGIAFSRLLFLAGRKGLPLPKGATK